LPIPDPQVMKNLYLVGMMGSGKSSTGEALASELSLPFVDLDEEIVRKVKMSVNEIFETRGEPYFRKVEKEVFLSFTKKGNQVMATGGGAVLDPENVALMKQTGLIIYLRTPMEVLWQRVQHKSDRPLLKAAKPQDVFARLFTERRAIYEAIYDHSVNTESKTPFEVAREIAELSKLKSHEKD